MEEKTMATLDEAAEASRAPSEIKIYGPSTPKEEPKGEIKKAKRYSGP